MVVYLSHVAGGAYSLVTTQSAEFPVVASVADTADGGDSLPPSDYDGYNKAHRKDSRHETPL